MRLTYEDLKSRYEEYTGAVRCECVLATELVGGLPASRDGLESFIKHHLKITDPEEAESALMRISKEEAVDVRPPEGEVEEKLTYGVRVIRKTEHGPWLGDWMVKACFKQAASRLNIFMDYRGTKGDFAEAGRVCAWGESLKEPDHPERIYLTAPEPLYFQEFFGRVPTGPAGAASIVHHSECAPPGTRFAWEYRFLRRALADEDIRDILALMMVAGIGSARSLERGHFRILTAEIVDAAKGRELKKKKEKDEKARLATAA
jgi:hypothetical protein